MSLTAVWYTGPARVKSITSEDWAEVGTSGSDFVWDEENNYRHLSSDFTVDQLAILSVQKDFETLAPVGVDRIGWTGASRGSTPWIYDGISSGFLTKPGSGNGGGTTMIQPADFVFTQAPAAD